MKSFIFKHNLFRLGVIMLVMMGCMTAKVACKSYDAMKSGPNNIYVQPIAQKGGSVESNGCSVVECLKGVDKGTYCNPYICTNQKRAPLEVVFDLTPYRNQTFKGATFVWHRVNTNPYKHQSVDYTLSINGIEINRGRVEGDCLPPEELKHDITIPEDMNEIIAKWEAIGDSNRSGKPGFLLIGLPNCMGDRSDAYIILHKAHQKEEL